MKNAQLAILLLQGHSIKILDYLKQGYKLNKILHPFVILKKDNEYCAFSINSDKPMFYPGPVNDIHLHCVWYAANFGRTEKDD